jgi:hypothetical protein
MASWIWALLFSLIQLGAFFSVLFQDFTLCHCWKVNWGFEIVTQHADARKRFSLAPHLYSMALPAVLYKITTILAKASPRWSDLTWQSNTDVVELSTGGAWPASDEDGGHRQFLRRASKAMTIGQHPSERQQVHLTNPCCNFRPRIQAWQFKGNTS